MKFLARYCSVSGCKSGYKHNRKINKHLGIRNESMFTATNEAQYQEWRKIIPRKDKMYQKSDVVCERHFNQDEIIRYYETKLPNGVVHRIERGRPNLKHNAVPTIFTNLPENLSKGRRKMKLAEVDDHSLSKPRRQDCSIRADLNGRGIRNRKLPEVGHPVSKPGRKKRSIRVDLNSEAFDNCHEKSGKGTGENTLWSVTDQSKENEVNVNFRLITCVETECNYVTDVVDEEAVRIRPCLMNGLNKEIYGAFNMTILIESVKHIKLPSLKWTVAVLGRDLLFLCFGSNFLAEKTLVVKEDLTIKVMFQNKEDFIDGMTAVKNMDDLIKIIGYLDVLQVSDVASDE